MNLKYVILMSIFILLSGCIGEPQSPDSPQENGQAKYEEINKEKSICVPEWECEQWSSCLSTGQKARLCSDSKNCNTDMGKPETMRLCTMEVPSRMEIGGDKYIDCHAVESLQINSGYLGIFDAIPNNAEKYDWGDLIVVEGIINASKYRWPYLLADDASPYSTSFNLTFPGAAYYDEGLMDFSNIHDKQLTVIGAYERQRLLYEEPTPEPYNSYFCEDCYGASLSYTVTDILWVLKILDYTPVICTEANPVSVVPHERFRIVRNEDILEQNPKASRENERMYLDYIKGLELDKAVKGFT